MRRSTFATGCALLVMMLSLSGCRYGANRSADFRDIFQFGAGLTTENPTSGMLPPSLGLYAQVTEFVNLGAVHFTGLTAEWDGRGLFAGPESRTRVGLGPYQLLRIDQDYENGCENYYKKEDALWTARMNSPKMRFWEKPAKELEYKFWANPYHESYPIWQPVMHRGWQYWENINVEASISEPFITHFGLNLKLGFDPSEIFDFLLGFATVDFKRDDLTPAEYDEMKNGPAEPMQAAPPADPSAQPPVDDRPVSAPPEGDRGETEIIADMLIIYFDYDKSNIRPDQLDRIEHDLNYLKDHPELVVIIEGHCDERGTNEYNLSLGERRAQTVRDYLLKNGIPESRMSIASRGEEQPAAEGHDESAWSQNRRVVFLRFK